MTSQQYAAMHDPYHLGQSRAAIGGDGAVR
jgi:hypothetical protein